MRTSNQPPRVHAPVVGAPRPASAPPGPSTATPADAFARAGLDGSYRSGARAGFAPGRREIPEGPATVVFRNANVFSGVRGDPRHQAVAIQGDLILAVGTNEEIAQHIDDGTRVIDAGGRTVLPGFIESHGHLPDIVERAIGRIDRFEQIADIPPIDGWIRAVGVRPPSLEAFDRLTGDTPAYIESHAGSQSWVNSAAMKLARAYWSTQETFYGEPNPTYGDPTRLPVPPGGRVDERTGTLYYANNLFFDGRDHSGELPTYEDLGGVMPQMSYEVLAKSLQRTMQYFAAHGITGFHNMMGTPHDLRTLGLLEKAGQLTTRVYSVQGMSQAKLHTMITPRFLELMDEVTARYNSDRLWTGMVKFNDSDTSIEEMAAEVARLNEVGLQAAIHTHGSMIEAIALAEEAPGRTAELRHRTEHTMGDVPLADRLGSGGTIQFGPPDRALRDHPNALEHWGGGTDWDVITDLDPMRMVSMATQSLGSVDEALHGYTSNAAWLGHAEDMVGSLEPGKKADVVMLSADILDDPGQIPTTRPVMTLMDGEVIYETDRPDGDPVAASYDRWAEDVQRLGLEAAAKQNRG